MARIIDRTPQRAHMTLVLRDLHWLPTVSCCQYKTLDFTYNVLHRNIPQYICDMISWYPKLQLQSPDTDWLSLI